MKNLLIAFVFVAAVMPAAAHAQVATSSELIALTNASRSVPLTVDAELTKRAQARADLLCKTGQWSHAGWTDSFKGLPWKYGGENLAKGFSSAAGIHAALMASPTHHANIVSKNYTRIGVGIGVCNLQVELFEGI